MERLRTRCAPAIGESATGWKLRTVEANGYLGFFSLSEIHKAITSKPTDSIDGLMALSALNGCGLEEVGHLGARQTRKKCFEFRTTDAIGTHVLDFSVAKVCPECLAEGLFARFVWDLELWIGCPTHAKTLVADCAGCGKDLSWFRHKLDRCCEGFPLVERRGEELSANALDLSRLFACKAGLLAPHPTEALSRRLSESNLQQLCMLVKHLGLFADGTGLLPANALKRKSELSRTTQIFCLAADMLCDWPSKFRAHIDKIASLPGQKEFQFRGPLRSLFRSLVHLLRGPSTLFISRELESYARERYRIFSPALADVSLQKKNFLTVDDVVSKLGVTHETLNKWLSNGFAVGTRLKVGTRWRWLISPTEVARLKEVIGQRPYQQTYLRREKAMSQKETIAMLGCTAETVRDFIREGLLKTYEHAPLRPGFRRLRLVSEKSVHNLLRRLEHGAKRSSAILQVSGATLPGAKNVNQLRFISNITICETIKTIIRHGIVPVAVDNSKIGLYRLLFSKESYVMALKQDITRGYAALK